MDKYDLALLTELEKHDLDVASLINGLSHLSREPGLKYKKDVNLYYDQLKVLLERGYVEKRAGKYHLTKLGRLALEAERDANRLRKRDIISIALSVLATLIAAIDLLLRIAGH